MRPSCRGPTSQGSLPLAPPARAAPGRRVGFSLGRHKMLQRILLYRYVFFRGVVCCVAVREMGELPPLGDLGWRGAFQPESPEVQELREQLEQEAGIKGIQIVDPAEVRSQFSPAAGWASQPPGPGFCHADTHARAGHRRGLQPRPPRYFTAMASS